jgi:hypothetical protein
MKALSILTAFLLAIPPLYGQSSATERVYLQTDKQVYFSGELLWMKLYTTDAEGRLTALSKIGYVELVADSTAEVQVMLDVNGGSGSGWMELPHTLPTGYYRLIAYTRYMRNEGSAVYFEKTVAVVNPLLRDENASRETASEQPAADGDTGGLIASDRSRYAKRSRGELRISGLPAENMSLAVSIAGVDPPFAPPSSVGAWRRRLPGGAPFAGRFVPEYEGAVVEGRVIDIATNLPAANTDVTTMLSFPGADIHFYGGQTDRDGNVRFFTASTTGRREAATVAFDYGSDARYRIDLQSPFAPHERRDMPALRPDSAWRSYIEWRMMGVQMLEACVADSLSRIAAMPSQFNYAPYRSYPFDDYTRFATMPETFVEFIVQARISRTPAGRVFNVLMDRTTEYSTGNTLVLLDNIPVTNHELMIAYNPYLIKNLNIYTGRYKWGGLIFDGILSFETYGHNYPGIIFDASTQLLDYEGAIPYRYFYAPAYAGETASRLPDFRHTLLWESDIESGGRAEWSIPFYTSDLAGEYLVTLEGIGSEGTVVRATCTIVVGEGN